MVIECSILDPAATCEYSGNLLSRRAPGRRLPRGEAIRASVYHDRVGS